MQDQLALLRHLRARDDRIARLQLADMDEEFGSGNAAPVLRRDRMPLQPLDAECLDSLLKLLEQLYPAFRDDCEAVQLMALSLPGMQALLPQDYCTLWWLAFRFREDLPQHLREEATAAWELRTSSTTAVAPTASAQPGSRSERYRTPS